MTNPIQQQAMSTPASEEVKCQNILAQKYLYLALDGELTAEEFADWEKHLNACPACQDQFELEKALKAVLQTKMKNIKAPESLRNKINQITD
jgi:anti-sigma factor (TIGR02949 family)